MMKKPFFWWIPSPADWSIAGGLSIALSKFAQNMVIVRNGLILHNLVYKTSQSPKEKQFKKFDREDREGNSRLLNLNL